MRVNQILAVVLAIAMAVVGLAFVAWGYVKRDALAERLAQKPCCPEQVVSCCPEENGDNECCPAQTSRQEAQREAEDGT
jgi:hypothetical protein